MTDLEKLYRAVAAGLQEVGVDGHYDRHLTEDQRPGHLLIIHHNNLRFQLHLSMMQGNCGLRRVGKMAQTHPGPDLADPLFFEKVRDLLHENFPGPVKHGRDHEGSGGGVA